MLCKLVFVFLSPRWAPAVCYTHGPLISDTLLPHKGRQGGKPALLFSLEFSGENIISDFSSAEVMLILQRVASIVMEI